MSGTVERIVYANGDFVPESQAGVSLFDAALTTGEKVVEVSRTFNQQIYHPEAHMDRLYRGIEEFGIPLNTSPNELLEATEETLRLNLPLEPYDTDWQVVHYISPGLAPHLADGIIDGVGSPTVRIHCIPLTHRMGKMATKYTKGVDLVTVEQRAVPQDMLPAKIKSSGRPDHLIARKQAQAMLPGATGVLLDQEGYVTEGTGSSLFIVKDGAIYTATTERALDGITRQLVFDIAQSEDISIEEVDVRPQDVEQADEAFLTSTVICQVHARSFDGKEFRDTAIGPVSSKIRQGFIRAVGLDFALQAQEYARRL